MTNTSFSGVLKTLAIVVALAGAMLFGAPRGAEAAPAIVSSQVAGHVANVAEVQYGGGHWRGHGRHHGRHFGHHRGRHFGFHRGRHFGHHHRGHRGFHGRRYRY